MIARTKRLRLGRDIERTLGKGRFGASGQVWSKALANNGPLTRVAVVVSKKVSKKAVVRNHLRRQIFAIIQTEWQTLRPGCDIVVAVRTDVSAIPHTQLRADILQSLSRSGAIIKSVS